MTDFAIRVEKTCGYNYCIYVVYYSHEDKGESISVVFDERSGEFKRIEFTPFFEIKTLEEIDRLIVALKIAKIYANSDIAALKDFNKLTIK